MAQINLTLNQEEILQLLSDNRDDAFRILLQESLNSVLKAESAEQLRAEPYERTEERTDSRNGTRERPLTTRIGTITLSVPRHRNVPFHTMVFDNYQRSEAALITTMAEMVIAGVSTRKVSGVMETLCGMEISKSSVSQACKELDEHVKEYRERALEDKYPFLIVDATYFSVRENYRVQSKALMIAIGITMGGKKEVLGFSLYDRESKETWLDFLQSLRNRGIQTVKLITSDAHEGIIHAINHVYPDTPWQRCQFHFTRNIADAAPKKVQQGLLIDLNAMFNCRTLAEAEKCRDAILQNYSDCAEKSMQCLMDGFYDAMSVMYFPKGLRKVLRTSNHIERLNGELKRRSQVIQIFPNQDSVIRTMGSVLMEISSKWSTMNRMFYAPAIAGISDPGNQMKIVELARRQRDLHKAA